MMLQTLAVMPVNMASNAAIRQRRRRERERRGTVVLAIEVDEVALAEQLVLAGFLAEGEVDNRSAIKAALERVVDLWAQAGHA
jgi:hypothetical protein